MKGDLHRTWLNLKSAHGYTLIEVMIVLLIAGILATGVVFMFANPNANVKTEAFTLLGELNMARSEAVNRNANVLVEFIDNVSEACQNDINECATGGIFDGYIICVDLDATPDSVCDTTDTIINITLFDKRIQLYDQNAANGPGVKPGGGVLLMEDSPDVDGDNDGVNFDGQNGLYYTPMGTAVVGPDADPLNTTGYVYIYYPAGAGKMRAGPYAMVISASTGRVRISRWTGGAWNTK